MAEQEKYVVFFEDDCNYLQHLKGMWEAIRWDDEELEVYTIRPTGMYEPGLFRCAFNVIPERPQESMMSWWCPEQWISINVLVVDTAFDLYLLLCHSAVYWKKELASIHPSPELS